MPILKFFLILSALVPPATASPAVLRTAFQDAAPKSYLGDDGKVRGLSVDIMQAVARQMSGFRFEYDNRLQPISRIAWGLKEGQLDVFFGMARSDDRDERATLFLLPPLYEVHNVLAVRADDPVKVDSFDALRKETDRVILTNFGTATATQLKKQANLEVDAQGQDLADNFRKLLKKRGRFLYFHDLGIWHHIRTENLAKKVRVLPTAFATNAHYLGVNAKIDAKIVAQLSQALSELERSGELRRIHSAYVGTRN